MKPRRKDEKKEEEVDLASLPPWNTFTVILEWHPFIEDLKSHFPLSQFYIVTREEVISFGKERSLIPAEVADSAVGGDLVGKSLKERQFFLDIQGRKAKKELIQKFEANEKQRADAIEKGQVPIENPISLQNPLKPDRVYLLTGMPKDQEEAESIAKSGNSINLLIYVRPHSSEVGLYPADQSTNSETVLSLPESWKTLQDALYKSQKNSGIRNLMFLPIDYQVNKPQKIEVKEDEKNKGKKRGRNDEKRKEELKKLEEKRKEEQRKIEEAKRLEEERKKEEKKKEEEKKNDKKRPEANRKVTIVKEVPKKEEEIKEEKQEIELPPDPKKVFTQEIFQKITDLSMLFIKYSNWKDIVRVRPLFPASEAPDYATGLNSPRGTPRLNYALQTEISQDDSPKNWDFTIMQKLLFSKDDSCAKTEYFSAVLLESTGNFNYYTEASLKSAEPLFEGFRKALSGNFWEDPKTPREAIFDHSSPADRTSKVLLLNSETLVSDKEKFIFSQIPIPGINRHLMPGVAIKSSGSRHLLKCESHAFSSFSLEDFDRMFVLKSVEDFLSEKMGEKVDLSSMNYSEKLSKSLLQQRISEAFVLDAEVFPIYYARDDSMILVFSYLTPADGVKSALWEGKWRVRPNFPQWIRYFNSDVPVLDFYDIDEQLVGPIMEKKTVAFPADGSVIIVKEYNIGLRESTDNTREELYSSRFLNYIIKDDCYFGVKQNEAWFCFPDKSSALAEASSLTLTIDGLVIKISEEGILQETPGSLEKNRVVTGKGSVIKYFDWGIEVLFANGNVSQFIEGVWTSTNNKGKRVQKNKDSAIEIDPLPCAEVSDPYTFVKTMIRDDGVKVTSFPDGSWITEHADGTKITADYSQVFVQCDGFAAVNVLIGSKIEAFLPDGSKVLKDSDLITYTGYDFRQIRVKGQQVAFGTGETLKSLKLDLSTNDFSTPLGLYIFDLASSKSETFDQFGNTFSVYSTGKLDFKAVSIQKVPVSSKIFVIENNNEGYEIMNKEQVSRVQVLFKSQAKIIKNNEATHHCFFEPAENQPSSLCFPPFPQSSAFNSLTAKKLEKTESGLYFFRCFTQHPELDSETKSRFLKDLDAFNDWKKVQTSRIDFGLESFETLKQDISIKNKILSLRKRTSEPELYEDFKNRIISKVQETIYEKIKTLRLPTPPTPPPVTQPPPAKPKKKRKFEVPAKESLYSYFSSFPNYFQTAEGQAFLSQVPLKPKKNNFTETMPEIGGFLQDTQNFESPKNKSIPEDSPFVYLEPQGSGLGKKTTKVTLKPVTKPSVFSELEKLQKIRQQAEQDIAEEYSLVKRKEFNLYGEPRTEKINVKVLKNSSPISSPNTKFILAESATDKRMRTISQSKRMHFKAPTVQEMRKAGTHNVFYKALVNKQSYQEMIDGQNMMISAYTNDPLKRGLQVVPHELRFGVVQAGEKYEMQMLLKNEDNLLMRYTIKQPLRRDIKVLFKPAPIAPGMFSKIAVEVCVRELGKTESYFEIVTKLDIYKIPVFVETVSYEEFERANEEVIKNQGRFLLKPSVKAKGSAGWGEGMSSQSSLPKLPKMGTHN